MNDTHEIKLALNLQQVNIILTALGQMPYAQVVALINEVKGQAEEQLRAAGS